MWPSYDNEYSKAVTKVLESGKVNYWTGSEGKKFENEFAEYFGSKYAVALANGTVAIDIALIALNIGKGDEVIVTSRSFIASISSIINCGAVPIFADVCPNSQNIRSGNVKNLINKRTKAILCVHLAGWPCEMDNIKKLASEHNLFLIEDCAQAHGAMYKGKSVGTIGDIGCWSFCQDKIMTTGGEGGMVTTNNKKLWEKMWSYKDHGKSYSAANKPSNNIGFRWLHDSFGTNWRMTEIQATIGRIQLKRMPNWTKARNKNQQMIWKTCMKYNALRVPRFNEKSWEFYRKDNIHAAYKCYVFIEKKYLKKGWTRDIVVNKIQKLGTPCFTGSCSEIYLEKAFKSTNFKPKERLKIAKNLGETSIMFQVHPTLTKKDMLKTCNSISKIMTKASK